MTDAAKPAVEIQDVSFSFGRYPALLDASATIRCGQFVSVVGPNGGGKTTLLKLILGLIQPDRGKIRVLGGTPGRNRRRLGYMPQHAHVDPQFPVTVMDVVLMGRLGRGRMWGPFRSDNRAIALAALEETEARDLENRPFSELSGGQRQKVLIARALACEPEMLLLDEPTSSLDPGVQDDVFELLHRLNQRMTVVLVSHDVSVVSQHVDKILCVNQKVEEHEAAAIKGALDELFPSTSGVALVQHGHDHSHDHHHHPGSEPR